VTHKTLLTEQDQHDVDEAIAKAHRITSARILPVITTSASRLSRAEEMLGFWATAVGLSLIWLFFAYAPIGQEWTQGTSVSAGELLPVALVLVAGFVAGILLGTRISWLRRVFLSKKSVQATVRKRAGKTCADVIAHEKDHPGLPPMVVVYVCLHEKGAAIVAGPGLEGKLSQDELDRLSQGIADGIAHRQPCQAISDAIASIAESLAPHCPPAEHDDSLPSTHLQIIN